MNGFGRRGSLDRTYEELKRLLGGVTPPGSSPGLDRTYEELKPDWAEKGLDLHARLDRTYEELKLYIWVIAILSAVVWIVPMRN